MGLNSAWPTSSNVTLVLLTQGPHSDQQGCWGHPKMKRLSPQLQGGPIQWGTQ